MIERLTFLALLIVLLFTSCRVVFRNDDTSTNDTTQYETADSSESTKINESKFESDCYIERCDYTN